MKFTIAYTWGSTPKPNAAAQKSNLLFLWMNVTTTEPNSEEPKKKTKKE